MAPVQTQPGVHVKKDAVLINAVVRVSALFRQEGKRSFRARAAFCLRVSKVRHSGCFRYGDAARGSAVAAPAECAPVKQCRQRAGRVFYPFCSAGRRPPASFETMV